MKRLASIATIFWIAAAFILLTGSSAFGATFTGTGNWNTPARWSGGVIPPANASDTIAAGANCTIPSGYSAFCQTLTVLTGGTTVTFSNSSSSLVIGDSTGTLTFDAAGTSNNSFNINSGRMYCGTINLPDPAGGRTRISISTGTLIVKGSVNLTGGTNAQLRFTSNGRMNLTGNFPTGGQFTRSTGTVRFNGTNQTIGDYDYYNLVLTNSGTKTLAGPTGISVYGTLTDSLSSTTLDCGAYLLSLYGSMVINGTISGTAGITLPSSGFGGGTANISGGTPANPGLITNTGTFTIQRNCNIAASSNLIFSGNVAISSSGGFFGGSRTVTNNGTVTCLQSLTGSSNSNSRWTNNTNSILKVAGSLLSTGRLTANATGNTVIYNGAVSQTVKVINSNGNVNYFNLRSDSTGARVIPSGTTLYIAGTFTPGSNIWTVYGSTVNFNGTGAQTIPEFRYYNLTSSSNGARVLVNGGTIWVRLLFTPGTNAYTVTNSTVDFDSSGMQQIPAFNYFNLTNSGDGFRTLANSGTIGIAGDFSPSSKTHTVVGSTVNFNGTIAQIIRPISPYYNNLSISGAHTVNNVSIVSGGNIRIAGTFSPTATFTSGKYDPTTSLVDFIGSGVQTIPAFPYYNLSSTGSGNRTLASSGVIGIAGLAPNGFSPGGHVYTTTGSTVDYNGSGTQTIQQLPLGGRYNNLWLSKGGSKTLSFNLSITGNIKIDTGATFASGSNNDTIGGNWTNNGTFSATGGAVFMTGSNKSIGGTASLTTFNAVNILVATTDTLNANINVSSINLGASTTLLTAAVDTINITTTTGRSANGIILGNIKRTHSFTTPPAGGFTFESQYNIITPTGANLNTIQSITVSVKLGPVLDYFLGSAVNRKYIVSIAKSGSSYNDSGWVRFHYLASELNGITESKLQLLQYFALPTGWTHKLPDTLNTTNKFLSKISVSSLGSIFSLGDTAVINDWKGTTDNNWNTVSNWSQPHIPANDEITRFGHISTVNTTPTAPPAGYHPKVIIFGGNQSITLGLGNPLSVTSAVAVDGTGTASYSLNQGTNNLAIGGFLLAYNGSNSLALTSTDGTLSVTSDVVMGGRSIIDYSSGGSIFFVGNLTQTGGSIIGHNASTGVINIGGDFSYTSGTFTPNNGTVRYNGASLQNVGAVTYNKLTINKPTGTAILNAFTATNSDFLDSSGVFVLTAPLNVRGNVTIVDSVDGASANLSVGGNFTINTGGKFIPNSGTVTFNGSNAQSIYGATPPTSPTIAVPFNDLVINSTGTVTLADSIIVYGNFTDSAGTLDMVSWKASNATGTGSLALAGNAYVRTTDKFFTNFGSYNLAQTSTVEYYGSTTQNIDAGFTFGNLTLTGGGLSTPKVVAADDSVAGNVKIRAGANLSCGSFTLFVGGNWLDSIGTVLPGTGTVNFYGNGGIIQSLTGTTANFYNLTFSGSTSISSSLPFTNIAANGYLLVTGTFADNGNGVFSYGNFTVTGQYQGSGNLFFNAPSVGAVQDTLTFSSGFSTAGPVFFDNSAFDPLIVAPTAPTFASVDINNNISFPNDFIANGLVTVHSGKTFNDSTSIAYLMGGLENSLGGSFIDYSQVIFVDSGAAHSIKLGNTANFVSTGVTEFSGDTPPSITAGAGFAFTNDVLISNSGGVTLPASTINGNLSVSPTGVMNAAGNGYTLRGNFINQNSFYGNGSSAVNFIASPDTGIHPHTVGGSGSTIFDNLVVSDPVDLSQNISVTGTLTANAQLNGTGTTTSFIAGTSSPDSITGTTKPIFDVVNVLKGSGALNLAIEIDSLTLLAINSGTLDAGAFNIIQSGGGGAMTMDSSSFFRVNGAAVLPVFSSGYTFNPGTTVDYYGGTQIITPVPTGYANLTLSGTTPTINNSLRVNGDLALKNSPVVNGVDTVMVGGNINDPSAAGTVTVHAYMSLFKNGVQTLGPTRPFIFDGLSIDSAGTKTMNVDVKITKNLAFNSGMLAVNGKTLTLDSIVTRTGGSLSAVTGIVTYDGIGSFTQNIVDTTYATLNLLNSAKKSMLGPVNVTTAQTQPNGSGGLTINKNFTLSSGATYQFGTIDLIDTLATLTLANFTGTIDSIKDIKNGGSLINGANGLTVGTLLNNHGNITAAANGGAMAFSNGATNNGTITGGTGTVNFGSTLNQSGGAISATNAHVDFSGPVRLNGGVISSSLIANQITFADSLNMAGGGLTLTGTGKAIIAGKTAWTAGVCNFASTSIVDYTGANQTIIRANYGNLNLKGTGTAISSGSDTVQATITLTQQLTMNNVDTLVLTSTVPNNVITSTPTYFIKGTVKRTNAFTAGVYYAFNRDSVGLAFKSTTNHPLSLTMLPDTAPTGQIPTKYDNRAYRLGFNASGDTLTKLTLSYNNSEFKGGLLEAKLGARAYSGGIWNKISGTLTIDSSATKKTITYTNIATSINGVTELGIFNTAFVAIANGNFGIGSTWDAGGAVPGPLDDAEIGTPYVVTVDSVQGPQSVLSLAISGTGTLTIPAIAGANLTIGAGGLNMSGRLNVLNYILTIQGNNFFMNGPVTTGNKKGLIFVKP